MTNYVNPRIDMLSQTGNALAGSVKPDLTKIAWVGTMVLLGTIGSLLTISAGAVLLFIGTTIITLCLGHSLGMHRRFIHRSYQCPSWLDWLALLGCCTPMTFGTGRNDNISAMITFHTRTCGIKIYCGKYSAALSLSHRRSSHLSPLSATTPSIVGWRKPGCCNNCHGRCFFTLSEVGAGCAGESVAELASAYSGIG